MRSDCRFVLHVGRHKTGTSSLQWALAGASEALKDSGVLYLASGRKALAHHEVALALTRKRRQEAPTESRQFIAEFQEAMAKEAAGWQGKVLLSSEAFQNAVPAWVGEVFRPSRTQVVVYLREQVDYLVSSYLQAVHARAIVDTLADFSERSHIDYRVFLKKWSDVYGRAQINARVYARDQLLEGSIVSDFRQTCGIAVGLAENPRDQNPSIGGALLEIKRILNSGLRTSALPPAVYQAFSQVAGKFDRFRLKPSLSFGMTERIRAEAVASNQRVARKYFNRETLFEPVAARAEARVKPEPGDFLAALGELLIANRHVGNLCLESILFNRPAADDAERLERNRLAAQIEQGIPHGLESHLAAYSARHHGGHWGWNFS
jgi:hypothetical protein